MKKIYAFDFDGTLTTKDTLLEFIRFAKGNVGLAVGFLYYSPLIILMKLHLYPNWKVKQKVFAWFFKGMAIGDFERLCLVFSQQSRQLILPAGMKMIKKRTGGRKFDSCNHQCKHRQLGTSFLRWNRRKHQHSGDSD